MLQKNLLTISQLAGTLRKRHFRVENRHDRASGTSYIVQDRPARSGAVDKHRCGHLRFAVIIDASSMSARVEAWPDNFAIFSAEKEKPRPVHESVFALNLEGLGYIAAANRVEAVLNEMTALHMMAGLDRT